MFTFIKLPLVRSLFLAIFEWLFYTGFTVQRFSMSVVFTHSSSSGFHVYPVSLQFQYFEVKQNRAGSELRE